MSLVEVRSASGLDAFVRLPWPLYAGDPNWVPPLIREHKWILGPRNPFWRHARRALYLLRENGRDLGRVAAIVDDRYNASHPKSGFFGFFECVDDRDAASELLNAAEGWLRREGMPAMAGPVNPSLNEEAGLLIEGYDRPPMIMMTHNPPYYAGLLDACGLRKAKDLFAYLGDVREGPPERLDRIARRVLAHDPDLVLRRVDMKRFRSELDTIQYLYNEAWSDNWGFVAMTEEEIQTMARRLKPLIDPNIIWIAEKAGQPVGFILAVPDYNQILKTLNGRLGIRGLIKLLCFRSRIDAVRTITFGVLKEFRKQGVDAALVLKSFATAYERGYRHTEYSWILEDNVLIQRLIEHMGGRLYKKYRIYEKSIGPDQGHCAPAGGR